MMRRSAIPVPPFRPRLVWAALLAALLVALLVPDWAMAHAVQAQCRIQGGQVVIEVFFDSDVPAEDAQVTISAENQQTVAQGRTDVAGRWSFPLPAPGSYVVKVDAGYGHRRTIQLEVPAEARESILTRAAGNLPRWLGVAIGLTVIGVGWLAARWLLDKRPGTRPLSQ